MFVFIDLSMKKYDSLLKEVLSVAFMTNSFAANEQFIVKSLCSGDSVDVLLAELCRLVCKIFVNALGILMHLLCAYGNEILERCHMNVKRVTVRDQCSVSMKQ